MKKLSFYDVKGKKKFSSNKYKLITKRNPRSKRTTHFAVSDAPSGIKAYRIVSADFKG